MGWLQNRLDAWGIKKQQQEFDHWYDMLSAMDGYEIGNVVAMATHVRHVIERHNQVNLLDPILTYRSHPDLILKLHGQISELQKRGQQPIAAGMMVWIFTLRAGGAAQMRSRGRLLWKTLRRGMPHVVEAKAGLISMGAKEVDIGGFEQVPIGLDPEPMD